MKRASDRQITKDDAEAGALDADSASEGSFQKAAPDVLAKRRIVKARRSFTATPTSDEKNTKPNPFAVLGSNGSALPTSSNSESAKATDKPTQEPSDAPRAAQPPEMQKNAEEGTTTVSATEPPHKSDEEQMASTETKSKNSSLSTDGVAKSDVPAADKEKESAEADPRKATDSGEPQSTKKDDAELPSEAQKAGATEKIETTKLTEVVEKVETAKRTEVVEKTEVSTEIVEKVKTAEGIKDVEKTKAVEKLGTAEKLDAEKSRNDAEPKVHTNAPDTAATTVPQVKEAKEAVKPNGATFKVPVFGGLTGSAPLTFANAAADKGSFDVKSAAPAPKEAPTKEFKEAHVETGEEKEQELFRSRVKLYSLENAEAGLRWKERGVGMLKLNLHKEKESARLLMRTEATLRVILNSPVYTGLKFDRATERSLRFQGFEEDKKDGKQAVTFLLRFMTKDLATGLVDAVENLKTK